MALMDVTAETLKDVRILLVEDNAADATLIRLLLKENGFDGEINRVLDGPAALDFVFRRGVHVNSVRPSVVFLDLSLPKMNGHEVLKEIKSNPETKSIPVIVLTTSRTHSDMGKSRDLGADAFFSKPSDLADFDSTVKNFLSVEFQRLGVVKPLPA